MARPGQLANSVLHSKCLLSTGKVAFAKKNDAAPSLTHSRKKELEGYYKIEIKYLCIEYMNNNLILWSSILIFKCYFLRYVT
jgi:hypothetical protein